jgi:hypothetical protein
MGLLERREFFIDGARDSEMQILAAALEQRFVTGVADQRVLELVSRIGRGAAGIEQFRVGETAQRPLQLRFSDRMNRP